MTQKQLHEMFEYKDGNLIYKIKPAQCAKIGDVAGSVDKINGYVRTIIKRKKYQAHRLIYIYHNGDIPNGMQIDHINQIKDDNKIENLRLATISQNNSNRPKHKNNTSGFKGVCWNKQHKKWIAHIKYNNKKIHLGCSDTPEGAYELYKQAASKYQGEFACWE